MTIRNTMVLILAAGGIVVPFAMCAARVPGGTGVSASQLAEISNRDKNWTFAWSENTAGPQVTGETVVASRDSFQAEGMGFDDPYPLSARCS